MWLYGLCENANISHSFIVLPPLEAPWHILSNMLRHTHAQMLCFQISGSSGVEEEEESSTFIFF